MLESAATRRAAVVHPSAQGFCERRAPRVAAPTCCADGRARLSTCGHIRARPRPRALGLHGLVGLPQHLQQQLLLALARQQRRQAGGLLPGQSGTKHRALQSTAQPTGSAAATRDSTSCTTARHTTQLRAEGGLCLQALDLRANGDVNLLQAQALRHERRQ